MKLKQLVLQLLAVVLLVSACASPAQPTAPSVDTVPLDVSVLKAQIAAPSEGQRITDPVVIALLLTLANGDTPIPQPIVQAAITNGLPVTGIMNISGTDYVIFQGSSTGLEPGPKSGFIVGYSAQKDSYIKIAANALHRENALTTGHAGVNAVLDQMWKTYGSELPDGFPRSAGELVRVEFPSGNSYLAYEAASYGPTINQMLLDGTMTPEQAAVVWRKSFLVQVEVAGNTGFTTPDPNPRNQAVITLKNGEQVGMPFDLEAKGAMRSVQYPEMVESMINENVVQAKKVHVDLDVSIPEELRVKYPVFGQVTDLSGFTFFNMKVGEEVMTLRAVLSTKGLKSGQVHALGGKVYQMLENGELVIAPGETLTVKVTTFNGLTDDVTITRVATAPAISARAQLGAWALQNAGEFVLWTIAAAFVDGVGTNGIRRIEMSAQPIVSVAESLNQPVTFIVSPDDIVTQANMRRIVFNTLGMPGITGSAATAESEPMQYESMLYDAEFSQAIAYETGYSTLLEFRAAMDDMGISPDVWGPVLQEMLSNTSYPFIIDFIGEAGRTPMNVRVSSYLEEGVPTLVFWGELNADEAEGLLRPFLVFQQTAAGWTSTYVGEYADNPFIRVSLTSWEESWAHDAVCYPGMNPNPGAQFVLSCQPPAQ